MKQLNLVAKYDVGDEEKLATKFNVFAQKNKDDTEHVTVAQLKDYVDYLKVMQPEVAERIKLEEEMGTAAAASGAAATNEDGTAASPEEEAAAAAAAAEELNLKFRLCCGEPGSDEPPNVGKA